MNYEEETCKDGASNSKQAVLQNTSEKNTSSVTDETGLESCRVSHLILNSISDCNNAETTKALGSQSTILVPDDS